MLGVESRAIIKAKEQRSEKIGRRYLNFRLGEIAFRLMLAFLFYLPRAVKNNEEEASLSASAIALLVLAFILGNIGNVLQAYQGVVDRRLALTHQEHYQRSDKLKFAWVAMIRGSVSVVVDAINLLAVALDSKRLNSVSAGVGVTTDTLGLVKNVRDTYHGKGAHRVAFAFCAVARPFLILAGLFTAFAEIAGAKRSRMRETGLILSCLGMILFAIGACIRQFCIQSRQHSLHSLPALPVFNQGRLPIASPPGLEMTVTGAVNNRKYSGS